MIVVKISEGCFLVVKAKKKKKNVVHIILLFIFPPVFIVWAFPPYRWLFRILLIDIDILASCIHPNTQPYKLGSSIEPADWEASSSFWTPSGLEPV